jgi:hypothetical protein
MQRVVICYVLTYASLLLALGWIGDIFGHARVFRTGPHGVWQRFWPAPQHRPVAPDRGIGGETGGAAQVTVRAFRDSFCAHDQSIGGEIGRARQ